MKHGVKTVGTYSSESQALLAQMKLVSEGIEAAVDKFSRYRAMGGGGYVLRVPTEQAARAQQMLRDLSGPVDLDEYIDADDGSYRHCPECRSVNVEAAPLPPRTRLLCVLSLGIPLLWLPRDYTCRKCGYRWSG